MTKLFGVVIALIGLTESVWAQNAAVGPGPELASGIMGMAVAAGAVYLISRRRSR